MLIRRPEVRTRQPQGAVAIDYSNPIARGLVAVCHPFSRFYTAPSARAITKNGFGIRGAILAGSPVRSGVANSTVLLVDNYIYPDGGSWWSANNTLYRDTGSGYPNDIGLAVRSAKLYGQLNISARDSGMTVRAASIDVTPSGNLSIGQSLTLVGTVDSSLLVSGFANGVFIGTSSGLQGYIYNAPSASSLGPAFGNQNDGGDTVSCQSLVLRWNRVLSSDEISSISANPWQIFAPERRTLFVPSVAGGTLNAAASGGDTAAGSATLAAQVALASVGVSTASGTAQATASIPLSAAGLSVAGGSANATATITLSAAGLAQAAGAAGLSASVLLAGAGAAQSAGNATLAAQLNALAEGAAQADGSANLTGGSQGQLAAQGGSSSSGQAALTVTISLQAAGSASSSGTAAANVLTQGGMAADGKSVASGTAAPTVRIAATADGKAQAGGIATGIIQGAGQITAIGNAQASGAATYTVTATLTAAGFVQAMGAARLAVEIPLAALGAASASGSASLTQVPDYVPAMPLSLNAALTHRTILLSTAARTIKLNHEVRRAYR